MPVNKSLCLGIVPFIVTEVCLFINTKTETIQICLFIILTSLMPSTLSLYWFNVQHCIFYIMITDTYYRCVNCSRILIISSYDVNNNEVYVSLDVIQIVFRPSRLEATTKDNK